VAGDLGEALAAAAAGDLTGASLGLVPGAAVTVVLAAGGYPERGERGAPIVGIDRAEARGALVFHAGTALHGDTLVANGGRILGVTGLGGTVAAAREAAYAAVSEIELEGGRHRTDIAAEAAAGRTFTLAG
jgi:phosphoribosylamine--glycine ligase